MGADALQASSRLIDPHPGDVLELRRLLRLMIVESDNVAANVVLSALGLDAVRRTARDLGLSRTRINGLYRDSPFAIHGAFTSADDLRRILEEIALAARGDGRVMSSAAARYAIRLMLEAEPDSPVRSVLPRSVPVCMKSGLSSDFVGHAILLQPLSRRPVSVVILQQIGNGTGIPVTSGQDFVRQDDRAVANLVKEAYRRYGHTTVMTAEDVKAGLAKAFG